MDNILLEIEPMEKMEEDPINAEPYAVVVGGVNIDIGGRSSQPLVEKDSNPGVVTLSLGGVGRNIAHNLSLLGPKVVLLTAFGDDFYAQQVEASCAKLGIDITHALQVAGGRTSTYVFLNDADGDMALAVSDMAICDQLTPAYLKNQEDLLMGAAIIISDTNIPVASLEYLSSLPGKALFVDPVSTTKAIKLKTILGQIHTLKPNLIEAELLTGVKITDDASMEEAARALLATGLKRVFISLGEDGVFAADQDHMVRVPCIPTEMVNATGAGDSFMAALAWSYMNEMSLKESAQIATAAASIAISSLQTINPDMSISLIQQKLNP